MDHPIVENPFEDPTNHETWDGHPVGLTGTKANFDSIDMCVAKNRDNAYTSKYHSKDMAIFRRGFDFEIKLNHSRNKSKKFKFFQIFKRG